MRASLQCAIVALATFGVTRLIDHLATPPLADPAGRLEQTQRRLADARVAAALAASAKPCPSTSGGAVPPSPPPRPSTASHGPVRMARERPVNKWKEAPEAEKEAYLRRNYGTVETPAYEPPPRRRAPWFAVIGFPIGIDQRNRDRRALLRELWYPEYANLAGVGGSVRSEFIIGLLTYQGDGHDEALVEQLHTEHATHGDLALVNAREATRDPYRGDPKCTGEKIIAWFQQVVVVHHGTRFFLKADWDTWIHTTRLEHNLRALLATRPGALYFGNTLWCSYNLANYQPCGYGFGPLQASGAKRVECPKLPNGQLSIGPFPYAAGLFWGMSYELVQWIAGSRLVYDFAHNASERFEPPYWVKGEDSAFGFFAHIAPFAELTPIHWGWDVVHDGWEFRSDAERGLCTHVISPTSLAVHSMHTRKDFELVRAQFRERCNATCETALLPFAVDGLRDLCARNPNIPKAYSKCAAVGYPPIRGPPNDVPLPVAAPRRKCSSVGERVEFIASKRDGGTISCVDDAGKSRFEARAL